MVTKLFVTIAFFSLVLEIGNLLINITITVIMPADFIKVRIIKSRVMVFMKSYYRRSFFFRRCLCLTSNFVLTPGNISKSLLSSINSN
jgi:hypothetical protein